MSNNTFLNRKRLNLSLSNRSSYKSQDVKKATVHSLMKTPIYHVPSIYPFDPSMLGFSVPYMHAENVPYQIHEKFVVLDSLDRDVIYDKNPYVFNINIDPVIRNVKYIGIDNVILPYLNELQAEELDPSSNTAIVSAIDASINEISIDSSFNIVGKNIQICNLVKNGGSWEINYTEDGDPSVVFRIVKTNSISMYRYFVNNRYVSHKVIFLQFDNIVCNLIKTLNQISSCVQLYPKKIIADSLWFNIKKDIIVFKNTEMVNIPKINIRFIDDDGNILTFPNLDYSITTNKYSNTPYSSPKYYIRHPLYTKWQVHVVFKFGVVEPFIKS